MKASLAMADDILKKSPEMIQYAPVMNVRYHRLTWVALAPIQAAEKVFSADTVSLVTFIPILDVDPNGLNPQNTTFIIAPSGEPTVQNGFVLYRHIPNERTIIVPSGQLWYAVAVGGAGDIKVVERATTIG